MPRRQQKELDKEIEECNESPPKKFIKIDNKSVCNRPDSSLGLKTLMDSKENYHCEEDGCCVVAEITKKKWGTLQTMARKSIRKKQCDCDMTSQTFASEVDIANAENNQNESFLCNTKDVELVKYVKNNFKKSPPQNKNKVVSDRIFRSYATSGGNSNSDVSKSEEAFQGGMKKRLNFLRESYRLAEKYQYRRLLQSLTTRTSIFLSSTPRSPCQRISTSTIPLIDLTKEKSSVIINRSREDIPLTSSRIKNDEAPVECREISTKDVIPRINSLRDYLKTNPVTEEDVVEKILSRHAKASNEKRKQAALEAAKLEVLNDNNRRAYSNILEERLKAYMRITSPVIAEPELGAEERYKLPELTPEQETQINRALAPSSPNQIVAERFGLQIKRRDMQTLKGLNWLNDEIINFYMNLIMERAKHPKLPNVFAFNTFFYPKLISGGHSSLKRWTKKIDIFSYDVILVPVHLGMHWCMSLIDFRCKEVRYYDSMGSTNNTCLQALLNYLEAESLDKKKESYFTGDWKKKNVEDIPQQMNGSDCGVFSCMFAEHLSRDSPILFTQDNMPYFRRKMVLEILEGRLLT